MGRGLSLALLLAALLGTGCSSTVYTFRHADGRERQCKAPPALAAGVATSWEFNKCQNEAEAAGFKLVEQ